MNINQPSADKLETLYPSRNNQDIARQHWYANKIFYEVHPDNPNMIRTYFYHVNVFANNRIDPKISPFHHGVPTDGMLPFNPALHSSIMRNRNLDAPF